MTRKRLLIIIGVLMVLIGIVWFLQGIGVLLGSVMSNTTQWTIIGALFVVCGVVLLFISRRLPTSK